MPPSPLPLLNPTSPDSPHHMAQQQPDFGAIGGHLHGLADEVVLLPNAVLDAPVTLQQLQQVKQNILQQMQQLEN